VKCCEMKANKREGHVREVTGVRSGVESISLLWLLLVENFLQSIGFEPPENALREIP
jgi:hypothetical protein